MAKKPYPSDDYIEFMGDAFAVAADEYNASCEGEAAEPFVKKLFDEWTAAGSPTPCKGWLKARLKGSFKCVGDPPQWIEEEPDWPYLNGEPMVFVAQIDLKRNAVTESNLTFNERLYVFGARVPLKRGFEMEYRIIAQER